jgi:3-deoxy-D-manno-octulosonic-acid transferase
MIDNRGLKYVRRSHISDERRTTDDEIPDIILLDTIGELSRAFSRVSIAFIGGSLVPVGGHNILEPAYWSRPVIFGPYMNNFPISKEFLEKSAAIQVTHADNISETVVDILLTEEKAAGLGKNAKAIVEKNTGSVNKALQLVRRLIGTA